MYGIYLFLSSCHCQRYAYGGNTYKQVRLGGRRRGSSGDTMWCGGGSRARDAERGTNSNAGRDDRRSNFAPKNSSREIARGAL